MTLSAKPTVARHRAAALFLVTAFGVQLLTHTHVLSLPYFWDEAGFYVPVANDFFVRGSLIPESVPTNAHPPLLTMYVSAWWRVLGPKVETSRVGMLAISAIGLWAVFRLGRRLRCGKTGILVVLCTATYPCYFAQSSMVLADLPAAAFSWLGLSYYLENRRVAGLWFSVAVLWKETAILVPLTLLAVDLLFLLFEGGPSALEPLAPGPSVRKHWFWTGVPTALLIAWYTYHWSETDIVFGNTEFIRYNVTANLDLSRFLLALAIRCWQAFGHLGMLVFSLGFAGSLLWSLRNKGRQALWRPALFRFGALVCSHLLVMSLLGGALLSRYLLPVIPLIMLGGFLIVTRRGLLAVATLGLFFVNLRAELPYHYAIEENLVYRDFVLAHRGAARFLEREFPDATIATAWPATFELTMPVLGYVTRPLAVLPVERPEVAELRRLKQDGRSFDLALVFNREYEPADSWLRPRRILARLSFWRKADSWFGTPSGDTPEHVAQALQFDVLSVWGHGPFRVALLRKPSVQSHQSPAASQPR